MFDKTSVEQLDVSNFDDQEPWKLKNNDCTFILFYADWCGHCQNFKPEYIKFAEKAQFMNVAALNVDNSEAIVSATKETKFPVQGFPTLLLYKNGKPIEEYDGPRTQAALVKRALKLCNGKCKCSNGDC